MRVSTVLVFALLFAFPAASVRCQQTTSNAPPAQPTPLPAPSTPLNFHGLPSAFLLSGVQMNAAISKGQELAKKGKSVQDIVKDSTVQPVGVKGEKGKSHESSVTCLSLYGLTYSLLAYNAANRYEPLPASLPGGSFATSIIFYVNLSSVPKVKTPGRGRRASEEDVQVDKFVLTDDKGNVFNASSQDDGKGVQSGMMDFSGSDYVSHKEEADVNLNSQQTAYALNGNSVSTTGSTSGTLTHTWYESVPWSESHPFYSARYMVQFPLFGADGQPLIRDDVKAITLHIITPNGEKDATFDLTPPKK